MASKSKVSTCILSVLALVWAASPVLAEEQRARPVGNWVITKAQLNKTECTCRLRGQDLPVGSEVCMQDSIFRCQMDQNVTTWRPMAAPCPLS
jgi:hypothetical protein